MDNKPSPGESADAFIEERRADIERIKIVFDPVYSKDIEDWASTIQCADNPQKELNWWLSFAELYDEYTAGMSLEERKAVFKGMYLMSVDDSPISLG